MGIAGPSTDLTLQFAIGRRINVGEGRTGGHERLRVGDTARGAENAQELIALAPDAAEHTPFLQNDGPGNDGKEEQQTENAASNQAGLREDISDVGDKNRGEQKNDVPLSESR